MPSQIGGFVRSGRSRSQKFPRAVGRWCSLAKVASLAIPSSPAGAAKARKEEQQWSAKAVISLPSPRSRLLLLLSRSLRMRCSTPDPGGNVRHAPAPLLFRPPVGIRTVTWPHTSAPPPAPNQSTKVLANPAAFFVRICPQCAQRHLAAAFSTPGLFCSPDKLGGRMT